MKNGKLNFVRMNDTKPLPPNVHRIQDCIAEYFANLNRPKKKPKKQQRRVADAKQGTFFNQETNLCSQK